MPRARIEICCDYCEKYSPSVILTKKDEILTKIGWKYTDDETICPACAKKGEYEPNKFGNRLKDVFKFKNLKATALALHVEPQNLTNLNNGKASDYAKHLVLTIIELAKELPLKKRRQIINNIDFLLDE